MKNVHQQETPHYESSTLPYVCWYQNDFLGGVRGMRAHEIGIYTILLNEMYARGRPLELSQERLARLCGCDKRTFESVLKMLIKEGKILNLANGLWNKRCENVFYERTKLLEQKSFAGRSSAKKRKKINEQFQHLLNESVRDARQNSESQKEEEKETPYGVSEKQFFLIKGDEKEERDQESSFSSLSSSLLASKQERIEGSCALLGKAATPGSPVSPLAPPEKVSRKSKSRISPPKGQRLPSDWQADISAAVLEGLSEEQARWQEKKFRDYWKAKSGKEALKVDWQATWRNWYRWEIERIKNHHEKLIFFASRSTVAPHSKPASHGSDDDALYRNLINYNDE
ncbi:uncharacterized protein YdaU (DUF1376 family) [Bartonella japonica]|uniref:Uncharacterized protein YdaU (DUF1376 family) n=1 Tax=Bartonella japonica TaxID=357761 RepID=A0ABV2FQ73_9HYPH